MTHQEHEKLWKRAYAIMPQVLDSLRRSNAIKCVTALHDNGNLDDEEYAEFLISILNSEGFVIGPQI